MCQILDSLTFASLPSYQKMKAQSVVSVHAARIGLGQSVWLEVFGGGLSWATATAERYRLSTGEICSL